MAVLDGMLQAIAFDGLLQPFPAERMGAVPISTAINNAGNEGPRCVEPLTE